MASLVKLFLSFLKIGGFAFGGGYAAIPLIQNDVCTLNHWITSSQFADITAVASMTPGPIAINSATYVGFEVNGIAGGIIATLGVITISFILIGIISELMSKFKDNKFIDSVFKVLRPVIIALILFAAINTGKIAFIDFREILICLVAFGLLAKTKVHPIAVIAGFGVLGTIIY